MRDRRGHWVKPARRVSVPAVVFSVVVDEHLGAVGGDPDATERTWKGASAWCRKRTAGRWGEPAEVTAEAPEELADWMHSHARRKARNYVVCPVASDVLTLCGAWDEFEAGGVRWEPVRSKIRRPPEDGVTRFRRLVLRGKPDIIDYTRYGFRWVWLSLGQFLPSAEDEIARSLGVPWLDTGRYDVTGTTGLRTPRERARVILDAFCELTDWWKNYALAPFGFTAGQLAMGLVRSQLAPKVLCTHNLEAAQRLERDGCYGGRATTWYVGDVGSPASYGTPQTPAPKPSRYGSIPGPLYLIDVRSMYPSLLRDEPFPVKLWSFRHGVPVRQIEAAAKTWGLVAACEVETERPEFPRRVGDRVAYPVGRFCTVLTAPEIRFLAGRGRIREVFRAALYDVADCFSAPAADLIRMREEARAGGDFAREFFSKLLGNSLGGKLAQHKGRWVERRKIPPAVGWGEWIQGRAPDGKPRRFRAVCGLVWEYVRDASGGGPHTAAFNQLTALGRLHMARIRAVCPMGSVVSQDTDGLWVTADGLRAIREAGFPFGDKAGELAVKDVAEAARFFGPRHYWTPAGWVLAGFNRPVVLQDGGSVIDTRTDNPVRRSTFDSPRGVFTRTRFCELKLDVPGQVVDPDGWTAPRRLG